MVDIKIDKIAKSRIDQVDFHNLVFGKEFSDHMFLADFDGTSWGNIRIQPYGPLLFTPSLSCMHYGQAIFEGMKAYRGSSNEVLIFRPLENFKRLNESAKRMSMPELPEEIFMEGLKTLCTMDSEWVPESDETSLYLRPFMIATDDFLGVRPSQTYTFIIYGCSVGAYYTKPLKVKIEPEYIRACRGGVGEAKTAGNYAAAMFATTIAIKEGFNAVLWTDALEHKYLEELGTSNIFVVSGKKIYTPNTGGTVLKGITRNSIIQLAKLNGYTVEERPVAIEELFDLKATNELDEMFATGTAATITSISDLNYKDRNIHLEVKENSLASQLMKQLENIKRGKVEDIHHWNYTITLPSHKNQVMDSTLQGS